MPSDNAKPPALPGPQQQGTPSPGAKPATPRQFRPRHQSSYRNEGLSDGAALDRIAARRAGTEAAADPQGQPQPAPQPQPGAAAPMLPAAPALPTEPSYSPLQAAVRPGVPAPAPGGTASPMPAAPASAPADPVLTLTIGGVPTPVPVSELVRGYMRTQDYTTKTQQAAEQLRKAQEAQAAFQTALANLEARLPGLIAASGDEFAQPVDWVKLAREDPIGYAQKHARFLVWQTAREEAENIRQLRQNEELAKKQNMQRMGHEFLAQVLPGWADPNQRLVMQQALLAHLREVGYTPEEIAEYEMLDPRHAIILEESRRFRALVRANPQLLQTDSQRLPAPQPQPPQRRGVMPGNLPGNGRFERQSGEETALGEVERQWAETSDRGSRQAHETAVSLIGARRAARTGNGAAGPVRPVRGRG